MLKIIPALTLGAALVMAACGCAASPQIPSRDRVAFVGDKGVNVHSWLTWTPQLSPSSYKLPVFTNASGRLDTKEIAQVKAAGFSFTRLTVDPGVFVLLTGAARDDAYRTLAGVIDHFRVAGLSVIVDMHPVRAVFPFGPSAGGGQHAFQKGSRSPFAQRYALALAWLGGKLDQQYAGTKQVAFELMNEPDLACGDKLWTDQLVELHRTVRAAAPHLALVLNGACWDGIDGLIALDPVSISDENVLYTFHFYDGHDFTHGGMQGSKSVSDQALSLLGELPYPAHSQPAATILQHVANATQSAPAGVQAEAETRARHYLASGWNRDRINAQMERVSRWAAAHGVAPSRILMGEFGANGRRGKVAGQAQEDRLRWLTDTRSAAEQRGFRWAIWQYRGNGINDDFDLELPNRAGLDPQILQALGLRDG